MARSNETRPAKETQRARILQHLLQHGSVTARELTYDYGMGSPRKRMSELRRALDAQSSEWEILDEMETGVNRYGEPVIYKRYRLERRAEHGNV